MSTEDLIRRIEGLAAKTGNKISTVCQGAFTNPRVHDRLKSRAKYDETLEKRLDAYEATVSTQPETVAE